MPERHRLAELAPRDIVAREIFREQESGGQVYLDARRLGDAFEQRFPGIFALCQARGIDPRTDLIPVTPAAHYMMGGVVTDLAGRSSLPRLYACGEVSRTGVHGANRLASNSLLEGLVFAERVARDLVSAAPLSGELPRRLRRGGCRRSWIAVRRRSRRTRSGASCGKMPASCERPTDCGHASSNSRTSRTGCPNGATEETNMVDTSLLIAEAALLRKESRGGHHRADFPKAKRKWQRRHIEW